MKLRSIKVNEHLIITHGRVATVYDTDGVFATKLEPEKETQTASDSSDSRITQPFAGLDIPVTGDITSVAIDTSGQIILTMADGSTQEIVRAKDEATGEYKEVSLTDSNGDKWVVDKEGNISGGPIANSNKPNQVDVSTLTDFEILIKEIIDSLYAINVVSRDSITEIQQNDQKILNEKVAAIDHLEENVENSELTTEIESNEYILLPEIGPLDSMVHSSHILVQQIEATLSSLNGFLDKIKVFADELKGAIKYDDAWILPEKRKRITEYINIKLQK
jgi:hypothetical protein